MLTREEVLERRNYIGSSDAAAALGLSAHKTMLTLWAEKTGQIVIEETDSEAAELGTELEDYVARRFCRKTGLQVERVGMLTHPQYPFLKARPDRKVVGENWGLECKTAGIRRAKEFDEDNIPQEYLIQINHQMLVTGYEGVYLAYLIGNEKFAWKSFVRDENIIRQILQGELNFWNNFVVPNAMPMNATANDSDTLLALFPESNPAQTVEFDDEVNRLIEFRNALMQDKYSLDTQIEAHENQIKRLLGTAEKGESRNFRVVWKTGRRSSFDTIALKEQRPAIYNQYLRETVFRKLKITSKIIHEGVESYESE